MLIVCPEKEIPVERKNWKPVEKTCEKYVEWRRRSEDLKQMLMLQSDLEIHTKYEL